MNVKMWETEHTNKQAKQNWNYFFTVKYGKFIIRNKAIKHLIVIILACK